MPDDLALIMAIEDNEELVFKANEVLVNIVGKYLSARIKSKTSPQKIEALVLTKS